MEKAGNKKFTELPKEKLPEGKLTKDPNFIIRRDGKPGYLDVIKCPACHGEFQPLKTAVVYQQVPTGKKWAGCVCRWTRVLKKTGIVHCPTEKCNTQIIVSVEKIYE
jgi:hypothetical protein